jgi:23S rRNA pseudoU1915 N3-methylase RlmH
LDISKVNFFDKYIKRVKEENEREKIEKDKEMKRKNEEIKRTKKEKDEEIKRNLQDHSHISFSFIKK